MDAIQVFSHNLRKYRKILGVSQEKFADMADIEHISVLLNVVNVA